MMLVKMCISIALGSLGTHRRASGVNVPDQHVYKASGWSLLFSACLVLVLMVVFQSDVVSAIASNTWTSFWAKSTSSVHVFFLAGSRFIDKKKDLMICIYALYIYIPYLCLQIGIRDEWMVVDWVDWTVTAAFQVVGGSASGAMVLMDEATMGNVPLGRLGYSLVDAAPSEFKMWYLLYLLEEFQVPVWIFRLQSLLKKNRHQEHWRSMFHHESSE